VFRLSYTAKCPVAGNIRVKKPIYSLGNITDIEGKTWNIAGIIGKYVQACPINELHPYYNDTSNKFYESVSQSWLPYTYEVVDE
jgi:hypothetical protein